MANTTVPLCATSPAFAIADHIAIIGEQPTTTTRDIAEVFSKRHDDVLRIVRQRMAEAGAEWHFRNFTEVLMEVEVGNGAKVSYPVIRMTEKGFMFVVQKFTGKKAVKTQIAYVDEFERMRDALRGGVPVTLYKQALQAETREAKSFALASAGSRAMLLRKAEKAELVETVELMREAVQLRLALGYRVSVMASNEPIPQLA